MPRTQLFSAIRAVETTRWLMAIALIMSVIPSMAAAADPAADKNDGGDVTVAADMKPYTQAIPGTVQKIDLVPIPGGTFTMGSPAGEAGRTEDEGPQHEVQVAPFWMGKYEITWDQYEIWMFSLDIQRRQLTKAEPTALDLLADAVTRPTKPYTDMTFSMGKEGYPAICMTQLAAKTFCEWLSAKTGRYYRLPTEAEWEYACRAGTTTAYSFGNDATDIDEYAWYFDNSDDAYHPVGQKKPNPWGLHDMHGNVCEWCLDEYDPKFYEKSAATKPAVNPFTPPTKPYPQVVRGGSWDDEVDRLRSSARRGSEKSWKVQDPQLPQSIWYYTDALFVGFRVVRPLEVPSKEQQTHYFAKGTEKE